MKIVSVGGGPASFYFAILMKKANPACEITIRADHANTVLAAGRADLTAMARPHLRDAYLTLHAAETYEHWDQPWPGQYLLGRPQPPWPATRRR